MGFGLSNRKDRVVIAELRRAAYEVDWVRKTREFNFHHVEIETSKRPSNRDESC